MGSYASYNDVHHPTKASALAEHCTACRSTGYVEYPRTVHETEYDPCPYGCMDADELLDMYPAEVHEEHPQHEAQYAALQPELHKALPDDLESAYGLIAQEYRTQEKDPFLTLSQQFRLRGLKRFLSVTPSHRGMVSSDDYIPGFMRVGRLVEHVSVPPYLVGQVIDFDDNHAHIRYEYLGSHVSVFVHVSTIMQRMRFAHSWDRDYSTASMMS